MVPGAHPYAELEGALLRSTPNAPDSLADQLMRDEAGLLRSALRILPDESSTLLLVVDQFEELFTLVDDEDLRKRFLANITTAVEDPHGRVKVVLTIRADFYGLPLEYPEFAALLSGNVVNVAPLGTEELETAAREPALQAGVSFEPALLAQLITDVGQQPGALPLFQYSLTELFDRRDDDILRLASYRSIGGVSGALGRRADDIYRTLSDEQRGVARQLFLRLITLNETGGHSRRRVLAAENISLDIDTITTRTVIAGFGRQRLLSFDVDHRSGAPTVEVAHEALLVSWPQLATWIDESSDDIRRLAALQVLAGEWQSADKSPDYLVGGARLNEFDQWCDSTNVLLSAPELEYMAAATARRDAVEAEEEKRREKEVKRLRLALSATAIGLVLALVAGAAAVVQSGRADDRATEAQRQTALAEARGAAARAGSLQSQNPALALALAAESHQLFDPPPFQSTEALVRARQAFGSSTWSRLDPAQALQSNIFSLAISADGRRLGAAGQPETVVAPGATVFDATTGQRSGSFSSGGDGTGVVIGLALSPDGRLAATSTPGGSIRLWDTSTGEPVAALLTGHEAIVDALAFSPDGTILVSGDRDGWIRRWAVPSGDPLADLYVRQPDAITRLVFSSGGSVLASAGGPLEAARVDPSRPQVVYGIPTAGDGGYLRLLDAQTGEIVAQASLAHLPLALAFSPDASVIGSATTSSDLQGEVQLWDAGTGEAIAQLLENDLAGARAIAFSPDGELLIAGGLSELRVWDVESGAMVDSFTPAEDEIAEFPAWNLAFTDTQISVAVSADSRVVRFTRSYRDTLGTDALQQGTPVLDLAVGGDGEFLISGDPDGVVRYIDATNSAEIARPVDSDDPIGAIALSSPSGLMAIGDTGGRVWVSNSNDVSLPARVLDRKEGAISALTFSPDGLTLVLARDNRVEFLQPETGDTVRPPLELSTGEQVRILTAQDLSTPGNASETVTGLAFAPTGRHLAASNIRGDVFLIELDNAGTASVALEGHAGGALAVAFSPDGTILASAGADLTVRLWDPETGEQIGRPLPHTGQVEDIAFSPDGDLLLSGDRSGAIYLWDPLTGNPIGEPMPGHESAVRSVAFAPNGDIVSGSSDGTIRLWDILSLERACELAAPLITADQLAAELGSPPQVCPFN